MKRYRVLRFDFDTRANLLSLKIEDDWSEEAKAHWRATHKDIEAGLVHEFGEAAADEKRKNFMDLGAAPLSVVAFHNVFLADCRTAFVVGAYYPSLTGACALGERILNHLLLKLRDDFSGTPEYKRVYRKDSFDNWDVAVDTLEAWGVLLPEAATKFRELAKVRNQAIHFNPETDHNDRKMALEAMKLLQAIVQNQFGAFGTQPWFIPDVPGEMYIRKEWESSPFVRAVYLPNCALVGPEHRLEITPGRFRFVVHDDAAYDNVEVSDEDFVRLRKGKKGDADA